MVGKRHWAWFDDVTNTREDANVSVRCSENDNVSSLELFKRNWVFKGQTTFWLTPKHVGTHMLILYDAIGALSFSKRQNICFRMPRNRLIYTRRRHVRIDTEIVFIKSPCKKKRLNHRQRIDVPSLIVLKSKIILIYVTVFYHFRLPTTTVTTLIMKVDWLNIFVSVYIIIPFSPN